MIVEFVPFSFPFSISFTFLFSIFFSLPPILIILAWKLYFMFKMSFSHNICLNAAQYHHITTPIPMCRHCFSIYIFFLLRLLHSLWMGLSFCFPSWCKWFVFPWLSQEKEIFSTEKCQSVTAHCVTYLCDLYIFSLRKKKRERCSFYSFVLSVAWQQIETEMV